MTDYDALEKRLRELDECRRLLGWVWHRSNAGCFSHKRSERDKALSDVNYWTEKYRRDWATASGAKYDGREWYGESP